MKDITIVKHGHLAYTICKKGHERYNPFDGGLIGEIYLYWTKKEAIQLFKSKHNIK